MSKSNYFQIGETMAVLSGISNDSGDFLFSKVCESISCKKRRQFLMSKTISVVWQKLW